MKDFLKQEYSQCFEQLRFYEQRNETLLKFLIGLTSAIATALFALYQFFQKQSMPDDYYLSQALLCLLIFLSTVLVFAGMLQNRLYYVYVVRQINAIRNFSLKTESIEFKDNQMYLSTKFPAIKPLSVHTVMIVFTCLISGLYWAGFIYGLLRYSNYPQILLTIAGTFGIIILESVIGYRYLERKGAMSADESIHGEKITAGKATVAGAGTLVG